MAPAGLEVTKVAWSDGPCEARSDCNQEVRAPEGQDLCVTLVLRTFAPFDKQNPELVVRPNNPEVREC